MCDIYKCTSIKDCYHTLLVEGHSEGYQLDLCVAVFHRIISNIYPDAIA